MADTPQIPNPYPRHRSGSAAHRDESRSGHSLPYAQQPYTPRWPTKLSHRHGEGIGHSGWKCARSFCFTCVADFRLVTGSNDVWFRNFWVTNEPEVHVN